MGFKVITKWVAAVLMIFGLTGTVYAQHDMHSHKVPLTEPGNDIFGTIQEVIKKLEADPNTDWKQVNLEALRQHLLDMKAFTEEVTVISKQPITDGVEIRVRPNTERAAEALKRVFSMHPAMVKKEKGWDMDVKEDGSSWIVTCTASKPSEINKIRALGYIGLLTEGAHHQRHHWMIATGRMKIK